ncbi:hypothetical protein WME95_27145 [Sorangium sp. So ce327]|jgi:hypothetical protein
MEMEDVLIRLKTLDGRLDSMHPSAVVMVVLAASPFSLTAHPASEPR